MVGTFKTGPQDLPPNGGYAPFNVYRIKLRTIVGARIAVPALLASTAIGSYLFYIADKTIRKDRIEMRSSRFAIEPLLLAEKDRATLKHMRRLRDEEADLMKDYPDWEVGTLFGEPVFESLQEDTYVPLNFEEYTAHSKPSDYIMRGLQHIFL